MLEVLDVNLVGKLAGSFHSLAEGVGHFADPTHLATPEYLNQDLVAQRAQLSSLNGRSPDHEESAHGIADSPDDLRQEDKTDQFRAARNDPAQQPPVAHATSLDVSTGDSQVRTAHHFFADFRGDFRGMLQVRIHDTKYRPPGRLPASYHGGRQTALSLSANDLQLRVFLRQLQRLFPGAIGTVIVDDEDLVVQAVDRIQNSDDLLDDGCDVFGFVVGRQNQGQVNPGIAVHRSDPQRTGA